MAAILALVALVVVVLMFWNGRRASRKADAAATTDVVVAASPVIAKYVPELRAFAADYARGVLYPALSEKRTGPEFEARVLGLAQDRWHHDTGRDPSSFIKAWDTARRRSDTTAAQGHPGHAMLDFVGALCLCTFQVAKGLDLRTAGDKEAAASVVREDLLEAARRVREGNR